MEEQSKRRRIKADKRLLRHMPKTGCLVYTLAERLDGAPTYVGQTQTALDVRLRNHLKEATKKAALGLRLSPVQKWMIELIDRGAMPVIRLLDDRGTWDITEAVWIDRYTRQGIKLLNVAARVR